MRAMTLSVSVHVITLLLVTSVYAATVAALHATDLSAGTLGLLAAGCAIGYALFARLFRQVLEVLLFGARSDPIRAASQVGAQLGDDPVTALRALRESLARCTPDISRSACGRGRRRYCAVTSRS